MYTQYERYLDTLRESNRYRSLNSFGSEYEKNGLLDFSTNDYLGLSKDPSVIKAAKEGGSVYGVGSTGSRLLSGNLDIYEKFENIIATDKGTECSLVFGSGFQANITALSSILDRKVLQTKPIVFFDRSNHSSLYLGVFLSGAELCRYKHNDIYHLESKLKEYQYIDRPKFIVTETVFGMDGDIAPIREIADLARRYNAFLYMDEAHATGVIGLNGYGLSSEARCFSSADKKDVPQIAMGTFSKAIGCSGGYIACNRIMRDFLVNKAAGFIYSTAPSPIVIAAALKSWQMVKDMDEERKLLSELSDFLRNILLEQDFNIGKSQTNIVPITFGNELSCLVAKDKLMNNNILTSCIRPPTVPVGQARLRIAITVRHSKSDIEKLAAALKNINN